jgi:hypothetical protein
VSKAEVHIYIRIRHAYRIINLVFNSILIQLTNNEFDMEGKIETHKALFKLQQVILSLICSVISVAFYCLCGYFSLLMPYWR